MELNTSSRQLPTKQLLSDTLLILLVSLSICLGLYIYASPNSILSYSSGAMSFLIVGYYVYDVTRPFWNRLQGMRQEEEWILEKGKWYGKGEKYDAEYQRKKIKDRNKGSDMEREKERDRRERYRGERGSEDGEWRESRFGPNGQLRKEQWLRDRQQQLQRRRISEFQLSQQRGKQRRQSRRGRSLSISQSNRPSFRIPNQNSIYPQQTVYRDFDDEPLQHLPPTRRKFQFYDYRKRINGRQNQRSYDENGYSSQSQKEMENLRMELIKEFKTANNKQLKYEVMKEDILVNKLNKFETEHDRYYRAVAQGYFRKQNILDRKSTIASSINLKLFHKLGHDTNSAIKMMTHFHDTSMKAYNSDTFQHKQLLFDLREIAIQLFGKDPMVKDVVMGVNKLRQICTRYFKGEKFQLRKETSKYFTKQDSRKKFIRLRQLLLKINPFLNSQSKKNLLQYFIKYTQKQYMYGEKMQMVILEHYIPTFEMKKNVHGKVMIGFDEKEQMAYVIPGQKNHEYNIQETMVLAVVKWSKNVGRFFEGSGEGVIER